MIDAKRYVWSKQEGLAKIIKKDDANFIQFKLFDVHRGTEIEPEFQQIDVDAMIERRDILQQEVDGINMILQDMKDLENG